MWKVLVSLRPTPSGRSISGAGAQALPRNFDASSSFSALATSNMARASHANTSHLPHNELTTASPTLPPWPSIRMRKRTTEHVKSVHDLAHATEEGYTPPFEGAEKFKGEIVHPQKWHPGVDCKGKKVVVIGSGATAATLVPAIADTVTSVTMLQRSPGYWVSIPMKGNLIDNIIEGALPSRPCTCQ